MTKLDIIFTIAFLAVLLLANESGVIESFYPFSYLFVFAAYLTGKYVAEKENDKKVAELNTPKAV